MISLASSEELHWLLENETPDGAGQVPRISLYMPTHRAGPEIRQDPIRYKNLLARAEEHIIESGQRRPDARDMLEPARRLGEDGAFWRHRDLGLAMFITPRAKSRTGEPLRYFDLPYIPREQVHVGPRLLLRPLLPLLTPSHRLYHRFYVMHLSQRRIELFASVDDHLEPVELPNAPHGMDDLQRFIDAEKSLQFHTGTGSTMHAATPGAGGGGGRRW